MFWTLDLENEQETPTTDRPLRGESLQEGADVGDRSAEHPSHAIITNISGWKRFGKSDTCQVPQDHRRCATVNHGRD